MAALVYVGPLVVIAAMTVGAWMVVRWLVLSHLKRRLIRAEPMACADLHRPGRLPSLVMVAGTAAPGPAGLETAPLSGRTVVWYFSVITRWVWPRSMNSRRDKPVWRRGTQDPFELHDSSGTVLISPKVPRRTILPPPHSGAPVVKYELARLGSDGTPTSAMVAAGQALADAGFRPYARRLVRGLGDYRLDELGVPDGMPLIVLGRPVRTREGGVLLAPLRSGGHGVSTQTVGELHARAREDGRTRAGLGLLLAVVLLFLLGAVIAAQM